LAHPRRDAMRWLTAGVLLLVMLWLGEPPVRGQHREYRVRSATTETPAELTARMSHPLRGHVRAVAADLAYLGMPPERARHLAPYIVSLSAYFEISPGLVLGVMLTENTTFRSTAVSVSGAVGLMQLMPGTMASHARTCGPDRTNDVSNICAGIHVLALNWRRAGDLRRALLNYNGCVRGTVTPNCFTYPDKVLRNVERLQWSCRGETAWRCVNTPVRWPRATLLSRGLL
jgi:soluble lytic murein transglycosylase-like protein